MTPLIKERIILAIVALLIVSVLVGLILVIFLLTGHEELLSQMLQSSIKGGFFGMAISGIGPFGMWIAIFLTLLFFAKKRASLDVIKIYLRFPTAEVPPPVEERDLPNVTCEYWIRSNGKIIKKNEPVQIQTEKIEIDLNKYRYMPYVYVYDFGIENPEFQIVLKDEGKRIDMKSDPFSPKKGIVDFL